MGSNTDAQNKSTGVLAIQTTPIKPCNPCINKIISVNTKPTTKNSIPVFNQVFTTILFS